MRYFNLLYLKIDTDQDNTDLTKKCDLDKKVNHLCGDIINYKWKNNKFDIIVSWLALYHIKKHNKLLKNCFNLINKNGYFFAEDIICQTKLNNETLSQLSTDLYANHLQTHEDYLNDLEKMGFKIIYHKNMTDKWAKFVNKRKKNYFDNKNRNIRVHGQKTFDNMNYFYNVVDKYFKSKKIGGIKVIAQKI